MRIECPSCTAVYELPERLLSGGPRSLRCAACGRIWSFPAALPEEAGLPDAKARPEPAPRPADTAQPSFRATNDGDFAALVTALAGSHRDGTAQTGAEDEHEEHRDVLPVEDAPDRPTESRIAGMPPPAVLPPPPQTAVRPSFGLILAWIATLGGLAALVVAFALFPQGVVARWPAAARLYEAVGITIGAS